MAEDKLRKKWITRYKDAHAVTLLVGDALGMPGQEVATIEDLFPEVYYMKKVRESHKLKLKSKGIGTDAIKLKGSGPVLPRLHQCFDKLKERWTPSFGQVFVTAKVESGVMIQATLG